MSSTTYLIADLHFDHEEVIDEFDRPFDDIEEMHSALIDRWNRTVSESDLTIVVGDFACVDTEAEAWYRLSQLNGDKILVDGNHRPIERSQFSSTDLPLTTEYKLETSRYDFLCCHKLEWIPEEWQGWKIYGHVHDRYPEKHPFLDPQSKSINVGAELLDYTPVSIGHITDLLDRQEKYVTLSEADESGST